MTGGVTSMVVEVVVEVVVSVVDAVSVVVVVVSVVEEVVGGTGDGATLPQPKNNNEETKQAIKTTKNNLLLSNIHPALFY